MTKRHAAGLFRLILAAAVMIMLAFGVVRAREAAMEAAYPLGYSAEVERAASEYGLEKALVYAVIRTESSFDPRAVSPAGAVGLMQLTPPTVDYIVFRGGFDEPDDITEPWTNIRFGCWLLRFLLDKYGDTDTALCAYNAGVGNVASWLKDDRYSEDGRTLFNTPFRETNAYVKRVNGAAQRYRELYFGEEA